MAKQSSNDKQILDLINAVNQKKEAIQKSLGNYKTNCQFTFSGVNVNLNVESDVSKLISWAAIVNGLYNQYEAAAKEMELTEYPPFVFCSFSKEEVVSDIKLRILKIQSKKKKDELEIIQKELNDLISPEQKAKMKIEELSRILGK